jgi:hypothetical protein
MNSHSFCRTVLFASILPAGLAHLQRRPGRPTTRGSAHAGVFHRIDNHFGIGIPEARAINPFSNTDWEGTGVEPGREGEGSGCAAIGGETGGEKAAEERVDRILKPARLDGLLSSL